MQTSIYPVHHGRTTEGTGRAKRPGHLFHLMTLGSPQLAAEPVNAVRPEIAVIDGRAINIVQAQAETPIVVGSEVHVLELVSGGVDTLGALVEATGLGRTTVQGRLKALVADGRLRVAQPARGGKPARYEVA